MTQRRTIIDFGNELRFNSADRYNEFWFNPPPGSREWNPKEERLRSLFIYEELKLGQLEIDERLSWSSHPDEGKYHRPLSRKRLFEMTFHFNPFIASMKIAHHIVISRRDGRLFVVDGWHLVRAAAELYGPDQPIVSRVFRGLTVKDEARLHCVLNLGPRDLRKSFRFWQDFKSFLGDRLLNLVIGMFSDEMLAALPGPRIEP